MVGTLGKLVDVTTQEQLKDERDAYRIRIDPKSKMEFAYYEVIDAGA
jgi:hypothetical protein